MYGLGLRGPHTLNVGLGVGYNICMVYNIIYYSSSNEHETKKQYELAIILQTGTFTYVQSLYKTQTHLNRRLAWCWLRMHGIIYIIVVAAATNMKKRSSMSWP